MPLFGTINSDDNVAIYTDDSTEYVTSHGATGDAKRVADAAMSSGSTTLTSASNLFVSGDVGKTILVQGAGAAGAYLVTTIATYVSAGQITLSSANASGGAVSSKIAVWGTDNATAIQTAIDALPDKGGRVLFPAGAYLHSATIKIKSYNIVLEGVCSPPSQYLNGANAYTYPGTSLVYTATTGDNVKIAHNDENQSTTANGLFGITIKNMAIRQVRNKTSGYGIRAVVPRKLLLENVTIDWCAGGSHYSGILLDGGWSVVLFENVHLYCLDMSTLSHTGATVNGLSGGYGIQMFGLDIGTYPAYVGADFVMRGNSQIVGWSRGVSIEGSCGGVAFDQVDIQMNDIGMFVSTEGGPSARSTSTNREIFLGHSCYIDSCFQYGMNLNDNSLQYLECKSWFAGHGRFTDGSVISAGFSTGFGISTNTQSSSAYFNFSGAKFHTNAGTGIQLGAGGNTVIVGCSIHGNGTGTNGGSGIYVGGCTSLTVVGNTINSNTQGSAGGTGYPIYLAATSNDYYSVFGNTFKGNTTNSVSDNTTPGASHKNVASNVT